MTCASDVTVDPAKMHVAGSAISATALLPLAGLSQDQTTMALGGFGREGQPSQGAYNIPIHKVMQPPCALGTRQVHLWQGHALPA